jgi:hypothetical protein
VILIHFVKCIFGSTTDGTFFRGLLDTQISAELANIIPGIFININIIAVLRVKGT